MPPGSVKRVFGAFALLFFLSTTNAKGSDLNAPLADAVERGDRAAVTKLIKSDVDVNAAQVDGMTALHWAVHQDEAKLVKRLLAAGADATAQNRYGVAPLSIACTNGNEEIVELLLDAGADPNTKLPGGETALMTAARTGKLSPVAALIERGAEVNATERKGQTALMWAAAEGHVDVVKALLEAGAEVDAAVDSGFNPLFFAIREGKTKTVQALLAAGADVNGLLGRRSRTGRLPREGMSPLILAVENGHFSLAVDLVKAGADPNDDRNGYTALHAITWVRKPVRGDGNPPPIGSGKLTSLQFVEQLVALDAEVDAPHGKKGAGRARLNRTDATPLLLAAFTGDLELLKLLVKLGADPHKPNVDDVTPLMAAAGVDDIGSGEEAAGTEEEAIATIEFLLELGADINALDKNGHTAMHGAAYQGRVELVQFLADHGADAEIWHRKNRHGWTPLMIAEGHRGGNYRPEPATIAAIEHVMRSAGIEPTKSKRPKQRGIE